MGTQCHLPEHVGYTSTSSLYPSPVTGTSRFLYQWLLSETGMQMELSLLLALLVHKMLITGYVFLHFALLGEGLEWKLYSGLCGSGQFSAWNGKTLWLVEPEESTTWSKATAYVTWCLVSCITFNVVYIIGMVHGDFRLENVIFHPTEVCVYSNILTHTFWFVFVHLWVASCVGCDWLGAVCLGEFPSWCGVYAFDVSTYFRIYI